MTRNLLLTLAFIASIALNAQNVDIEKNKQLSTEMLEKGNAALFDKEYENARYYFKVATELDPTNAQAYCGWAKSITNLACTRWDFELKQYRRFDFKLYKEALIKYEQATKLDSENGRFYYEWGNALLRLSKETKESKYEKEGLTKYEQAAKIDPKYTYSVYQRGVKQVFQNTEEGINRYREYIAKYERDMQPEPKYALAYMAWGRVFEDWGHTNKDTLLLKESIAKYERAMTLAPTLHYGYEASARVLISLADKRQDEKLKELALERYEKAVSMSDNPHSNIMYGVALFNQKDEKKVIKHLEESLRQFEEASRQIPNDCLAFYNMGVVLSKLGHVKQDVSLLNRSVLNYEKAISKEPTDCRFYIACADALTELAKLKQDADLYKDSFIRYEQAIEFNYRSAEAYNNWGHSILALAKMQGNVSERKKDIEEKLLKAEKHEKGKAVFNMACLYSLLNEKDKAFGYFKQTLEKNEQSTEFIKACPDFDNLKGDVRYQQLLDEYRPIAEG